MPSRIIKESICTSDNIDQLSAFQETMFYRLIVNCDDYGRFDGRPKILASKLFPLKDIRTSQIEDGLRALTSAELVILYEVDGKPFVQMKTWDRHQQIRAKKSKYPAPENNGNQNASICNQLKSNDIKCPRNPIQSESNPNPNPNTNTDAPGGAPAPTKGRFIPPTRDEAEQYAREKGLQVDVERFLAYYESNGWKVGKNPMKSWQAAMVNWSKNDFRGRDAPKTVNATRFKQRDYTEQDMRGTSLEIIREAMEAGCGTN